MSQTALVPTRGAAGGAARSKGAQAAPPDTVKVRADADAPTDGEPLQWFMRYKLYRDLGSDRSLNAAYQKGASGDGTKANQKWRDACRKYDWEARAKAWDAAMAVASLPPPPPVREQTVDVAPMLDIVATRRQWDSDGKRLRAVALGALEHLVHRNANGDVTAVYSEVVRKDPSGSYVAQKLASIKDALDLASKLEARAAGIPETTSFSANAHHHSGSVSVDGAPTSAGYEPWKRQLEAILAPDPELMARIARVKAAQDEVVDARKPYIQTPPDDPDA